MADICFCNDFHLETDCHCSLKDNEVLGKNLMMVCIPNGRNSAKRINRHVVQDGIVGRSPLSKFEWIKEQIVWDLFLTNRVTINLISLDSHRFGVQCKQLELTPSCLVW